MAREKVPFHRPIAVKFTEPATGKSVSFTVYGDSLLSMANEGWAYFRGRYLATDINDARHKRRL